MTLSLTVGFIVIVVIALVGIVGYAVDRSAGPGRPERPVRRR
jgi:hypothetical protein